MRFYIFIPLFILSLALAGCLGTNSDTGSDPMSSGLNYYYAEFSDVAIPNEMQPDKNDTFITYSSDGIKLGTQVFKGRVDLSSLVSAMQGHMQRDSWILRSIFRATKGSILIFEQQKKMCSMYIFEDIFNTKMIIFVSPKLAEGVIQHSVPVSTYSEPLTPAQPLSSDSFSPSSPPVAGSGNITVYPAN